MPHCLQFNPDSAFQLPDIWPRTHRNSWHRAAYEKSKMLCLDGAEVKARLRWLQIAVCRARECSTFEASPRVCTKGYNPKPQAKKKRRTFRTFGRRPAARFPMAIQLRLLRLRPSCRKSYSQLSPSSSWGSGHHCLKGPRYLAICICS